MSLPNSAQQALEALPALPRDAGGPVFAAPWEAQVFAITLSLHQQGLFTWPEWAKQLGAAIQRAKDAGDPDTGESYYAHWLDALENMLKLKGVAAEGQLESLQLAWDQAAKATPHGEPIELA